MKPLVKVPPEWMARSLAWAERSVAGYNNGEKERSRALARPGIDKSVDAQLLGKAGECAFCKFMCLDPGLLDWGPKCDRGWDIEYLRHLIDVKASGTRLLIWPVTKNEFLSETPAELFAAVHRPRRDEVDTYEMLGWTTVSIFVTQHLTARPPDYLDQGTKHLPEQMLFPMEELRVSPIVRTLLTKKIGAILERHKAA